MKIKAQDLSGIQLDWAVAKCEGYFSTNGQVPEYWESPDGVIHFLKMRNAVVDWTLASTDWAEMGSIIEREMVNLDTESYQWRATVEAPEGSELNFTEGCGPTPLIAAARCYVASKLGDEVEIPEELL
jgi:hypothetical protein